MMRSVRKYLSPVRWLLKHGNEAVSQRGRMAQLVDMYRCGAAEYLPSHYYYWKLYRERRIEELHKWVRQQEAHQFSRVVAASVGPAVSSALLDKGAFDAFCHSTSLPAIRVLASIDPDTSWSDFSDIFSTLRRDLFVKPREGLQAMGTMKFIWDGERHLDVASRDYDAKALWSWLRDAIVSHGSYVLQPVVRNHASLEELSGGSLVCVRVLTYSVHAVPRVAMAAIWMPAGNSHVSNFTHEDALGAPVDRVTGILGSATLKARCASPPVADHPATGAQIAGRQLPFWDQVIALVTRAHLAFENVPMIGWDVAITPEGPLLIEGNLDMGVESLQVVHGAPLSDFFDFRNLVSTYDLAERRL